MTSSTAVPGPDDWDGLARAARAAAARASAPYSGLPVGAAAVAVGPDGAERLVSGCNVENASYGLTLCAECTLVGQLHLTGGGRLVRLACTDGEGRPLAPCGRCRQLLWEAGGPGLLVAMPGLGAVPMTEVLPGAFDADELPVAPATDAAPPSAKPSSGGTP